MSFFYSSYYVEIRFIWDQMEAKQNCGLENDLKTLNKVRSVSALFEKNRQKVQVHFILYKIL